MRSHAWSLAIALYLLTPGIGKAQSVGQVECPRSGGYVYLYSSMVTMDVRTTLQCGEQVEITGRYDGYFGVRTAKGEIGYVPTDSLVLLKTKPGTKVVLPPPPEPQKTKMIYDDPSLDKERAKKLPSPTDVFTLLDSTPIHVKLGKALSSSSAQVGDEVSFEVLEDVVVDGLLVIAKGALASGVVNEAEPKKSMGRGGKLGVLVKSVRLTDEEKVMLRSGGEGRGSSSAAGAVIPVMHGKDITFPQGMEFIGYVNGDIKLKRENFRAASNAAATPAAQPSNPAPATVPPARN